MKIAGVVVTGYSGMRMSLRSFLGPTGQEADSGHSNASEPVDRASRPIFRGLLKLKLLLEAIGRRTFGHLQAS